MPITDAHHHLWWLDRTPWPEFAADARAHGVGRSIYVQVNVAPDDEVDEVAWATEAGARAGLVQGIVAFADLAAPGVGEVLDRLLDVFTGSLAACSAAERELILDGNAARLYRL